MKPLIPRGVYAITPDEQDTKLLLSKVEAALKGGVRLLQYRNKQADAALQLEQALALRELTARYQAVLIINDSVPLAEQVSADGAHLGKTDGQLRDYRQQLDESFIFGASAYNQLDRAEAARAAGADYVAFGSMFCSPTKPDAVHAPIELIALARQRLDCPIVAIGGITKDNAIPLISAGVTSIAVISALFQAEDIERTAAEFTALFN